MLTKAPRGTKDVLTSESYKWQYLEKTFKEICKNFGYGEIRTPIFEHTELFERGVGETSDVVQKEMYTFFDKGERSITLKPEGTSSVVRAFVENKIYTESQPTKVYYVTPCFRYERPEAGRLRQFHQFGVEAFGSDEAALDVEVMSLVDTFFKKLGLKNIDLHINSIGCPKCREEYNRKLRDYLSEKIDDLCSTCDSRYEKNPMRILDCKTPSCKEKTTDAPLMIDNLCDCCEEHFGKVKEYLKLSDVEFVVDAKIVRGLDYYTKTAFEFISNDIGSQGTVSGGGRYDGLVSELGGPSTPSVGFGMGIERLLLTLENNNIEIPKEDELDLFIVTMGEEAEQVAFKLLANLRRHGISADKDYLSRGMKAQFKYANKVNAKYTVVIGESEIEKNVVTLKDMESGEQKEVSIDQLIDELGGNN